MIARRRILVHGAVVFFVLMLMLMLMLTLMLIYGLLYVCAFRSWFSYSLNIYYRRAIFVRTKKNQKLFKTSFPVTRRSLAAGTTKLHKNEIRMNRIESNIRTPLIYLLIFFN